MCSMVTLGNRTVLYVHLKVAKRVDLKCSHHTHKIVHCVK